MNVLHVASEVTPFSKTGGLGDVVGSLPKALAEREISKFSIRDATAYPRYNALLERIAARLSQPDQVKLIGGVVSAGSPGTGFTGGWGAPALPSAAASTSRRNSSRTRSSVPKPCRS